MRAEEVRLKDGSLGLAIPAELCELLARVLTDVDANHRRANHGPGIRTELLRLRDDMARIGRIRRSISHMRNKPDQEAQRQRSWGTVREAAQRLNRSDRRIQQLAEEGKLGAVKVGGVWLIPFD